MSAFTVLSLVMVVAATLSFVNQRFIGLPTNQMLAFLLFAGALNADLTFSISIQGLTLGRLVRAKTSPLRSRPDVGHASS